LCCAANYAALCHPLPFPSLTVSSANLSPSPPFHIYRESPFPIPLLEAHHHPPALSTQSNGTVHTTYCTSPYLPVYPMLHINPETPLLHRLMPVTYRMPISSKFLEPLSTNNLPLWYIFVSTPLSKQMEANIGSFVICRFYQNHLDLQYFAFVLIYTKRQPHHYSTRYHRKTFVMILPPDPCPNNASTVYLWTLPSQKSCIKATDQTTPTILSTTLPQSHRKL